MFPAACRAHHAHSLLQTCRLRARSERLCVGTCKFAKQDRRDIDGKSVHEYVLFSRCAGWLQLGIVVIIVPALMSALYSDLTCRAACQRRCCLSTR